MAKLHIKNMVCDRCLQTVERILSNEGLTILNLKLGEVIVEQDDHEINKDRLEWQLRDVGFELIYDKNEQLVALTKAAMIRLLDRLEEGEHQFKISVMLSEELNLNYQQISRTFSELTGDTVEKYFLKLKVERVKELITYDELTLSEIAWKLGYSSVQHLSMQFKQITGITVREFKSPENEDRTKLDKL